MKKWAISLIGIVAALLTFAPASAQTQEAQATKWWNDRVFYEVFVRSFYDSSGDGIGDLKGLIQKLDYLNDGDPNTTTDLGVTGLWLMPIMEAPSYHGYDTTDYRTVEQDYGSNDDFKQLIDAAHQRGIAVIVDLVVNHTSDQHPWFKASAAGDPQYADWYRWMDTDPKYRGPWGEQVWYPLNNRFYYAIFCGCQPDLNYENPAVIAEMDDIARFWLQDMGADGFRLDALQHIIEDGQKQANTDATHQWAEAFNSYIQSVNPDALTVGEVNGTDFLSAPYVPGGADLTFDFDLAGTMVQSAADGKSDNVISLQKRAYGLYPPNQYAGFLTNHDQTRVMSALQGNVDKAKVAADLLLTQPGVPFVYYGEELGMQGIKGATTDIPQRTPMQWDSIDKTAGFTTGTPWTPLQNDIATVNVATESADPNSLLSHYRDLIHLREDNPALEHGDFVPVVSGSHQVYSFLRRSDDETVMVVINLSSDAVSDYALKLAKGFSAGQATLLVGSGELAQPQVDTNGGFSDYRPLAELPPYSLTVIRFAVQ